MNSVVGMVSVLLFMSLPNHVLSISFILILGSLSTTLAGSMLRTFISLSVVFVLFILILIIYSITLAFDISSSNFSVFSVVPSTPLAIILFSSTMLSATSLNPLPSAALVKAESLVFFPIKSVAKLSKIKGVLSALSKLTTYTLLPTK